MLAIVASRRKATGKHYLSVDCQQLTINYSKFNHALAYIKTYWLLIIYEIQLTQSQRLRIKL